MYDVRERVSQTAVPLGSAEIALGAILETSRLRIALQSNNGNAGFITVSTWAPDQDRKIPRSPARKPETYKMGHRRSQSLPPKLGVKLFVPNQGKLPLIFKNPSVSMIDNGPLKAITITSAFLLTRSIHIDCIRAWEEILAFTN